MITRVAPRPSVGIAVLVIYAVLFMAYEVAVGPDYEEIASSTRNVVTGIVIPVGVGAALLIAVAWWLGWLRPALFERASGPRWLLLVPALVTLAIIVNLATGGIGDEATGFLITLLIASLLVGLAEELLTRGILVVGLRGGMGEVAVWLLSSALFGLLHGLNFLIGQPIGPTIQQIIFASVFGLVFYVIRRATGTLLVCMVLHGLWDFSVFISTGDDHEGAQTEVNAGILIAYVAVILMFVGARKLLRQEPITAGAPAPA